MYFDTVPRTERLERPTDERLLAGVCAGFARHTGLPVQAVRIGAVVLGLVGGFGVALYAWLWATTPVSGSSHVPLTPMKAALTKPAQTKPALTKPAQATTTRRPFPIAELLLGSVLLITGLLFGLVWLGVDLPLTTLLPGFAVIIGVGITWWQISDASGRGRSQTARTVGALLLVAIGVLTFFVASGEPNTWTIIAAALAVLGGVALAIAPWLLRINRDLMAERAARAREAERSDIAAHLHDSVLQTLALIQQQSPPESEAARLARGQERELREWLFRGETDFAAAPGGLAGDLQQHANTLEQHHPVRFEVVTVGESARVPEAVLAAAREAMVNAARHAGGEVSVYLEKTPKGVEIEVIDRGPGFHLDSLPTDRMGVRESIIGRMERAGGKAIIVPGPGGTGTAVRLHIDTPETEAP